MSLTPNHNNQANEIFPIVLTFDEQYTPWAAITLQSLIKNCKTKFIQKGSEKIPLIYRIYVLHTDLSQNSIDTLNSLIDPNENIELVIYNLNNSDQFNINQYYNNTKYITVSTYFRLEIARLLGDVADFCLYLDCDLVVTMDPIWFKQVDQQMQGHLFGGVHDFFIDYLINPYFENTNKPYPLYSATTKDMPYTNKSIEEIKQIELNSPGFDLEYYQYVLNFKHRRNYINAGVLYINLKLIREQNLAQTIANLPKEIKKPHFRDQDLINYAANKYSDGVLLIDQPDWIIYQHNRYVPVNTPYSGFEKVLLKANQDPLKFEQVIKFFDKGVHGYMLTHINQTGIHHYSGLNKPWVSFAHDSCILWWACVTTMPNADTYFDNFNIYHMFTPKEKHLLQEFAKIYFNSDSSGYVKPKFSLRNIKRKYRR